MTPERWQKVKDICYAVLDRDADRRSAVLRELCGDDEELRREVEVMVADACSEESVLLGNARPAVAAGGILRDAAAGTGPVHWKPDVIGDFRILRVIGEGGMGIVYEAEQREPARTVALKVIKPGLATPEVLRRFRQETHALGRLQHPGIAQIYEAGTAETPFGPQPYFAMEFIRGKSLRAYFQEHHPGIRERLELIARICDAVHHAHQRGLIHRDLKPSNILIDDTGQPKVLDFGVARLTDSDVHSTRQTDLGQLVGTLAYMSPEQVLADPLELDTRSDVYALGVILYELLAERLPYTVSTRLHEAVQTIQHEDPKRLSAINRTYRGDLETIAAKALEKDKTRRYGSAAALAADIRRYLHDEPIAARPASASYQLKKFARRNRALVAGAAAVFVVLIAGTAGSTWQAMRANRERDRAVRERERADSEAATAKAISEFLQKDLLAQAAAGNQIGSGLKPDPDMKVRTALDRAAARIDGRFPDKPAVQASVRQTLSETYLSLGLYDEAERELVKVVDTRLRVLGPQHRDSAYSLLTLGAMYRLRGKMADAEKALAEAMTIQRRAFGDNDEQTLEVANELALLYLDQGRFGEAEPLARVAMEGVIRLHGDNSVIAATLIGNLGLLYWQQGKYREAEERYKQSLAIRRRLLGDEHPDTMININNLAVLYISEGRFDEAEKVQTQLLDLRRRVLGPEHPDVLFTMHNLADIYVRSGRYDDAEALNTRLQEIQRRVLGESHPLTLLTLYQRGIYQGARGQFQASDETYKRVLTLRRPVLGDKHPETVRAMIGPAINASLQNRFQEAEPVMAKCYELWRETLGAGHPDTINGAMYLGDTRINMGKFAEAETVLRDALSAQEKANATVWSRYNLSALLGAALAGQKRFDEAEPLFLSGYKGMVERQATMQVRSRIYIARARERLVEMYRAWGKPDRVPEWSQRSSN